MPAACSLDTAGQAEQGGRYRALSASLVSLERRPGRLAAVLGPGADTSLVGEAIRVERACCPFLEVGFDAATRTLTIEAHEDHQPVLDAIAAAFDPHGQPSGSDTLAAWDGSTSST